MPFNSLTYLCFYVATLILSWSLAGIPKLRIWVVLFASLYFYGKNNSWLVLLLLLAIQIDYVAAKVIEDAPSQKKRELFLVISVVTNLGILGFFKYFNFFASSFAGAASFLGIKLDWVDLKILLPVGISFYTFESMSYTIDVYQGKLKAIRSWYKYAFFVSYFPHLVAGPIVRPVDFMPQVERRATLKREQLEEGLVLVFRGLAKKIVFADFLAKYANAAFEAPGHLSFVSALLGTYAFTFQIYFDFSGYSDIAIGCSRLEGFWLPDNFRRPYISRTITEFWRRWHISLSSWLRDYLYIPLGGGRMPTRAGVYRNLMITMILGGLWHGAAWHFVLWGTVQGVLLVAEKHFGLAEIKEPLATPRSLFRMFVTFHLVCFSWILFRAETMRSLGAYLQAFGRFQRPAELSVGLALVLVVGVGGVVAQWVGERSDVEKKFTRLPIPLKAAVYAAVSIAVTVFGGSSSQFIYFQF